MPKRGLMNTHVRVLKISEQSAMPPRKRKKPTAALSDALNQVHQWLDIAFDEARALSHEQLPGRNHVLTDIYKLKKDLAASEDRQKVRSASQKKRG